MNESKSSMDRSQQDKHECTAERSINREGKHEETVLSPSYQHSRCAGLQFSLLKGFFMTRDSRPLKTDVQTSVF